MTTKLESDGVTRFEANLETVHSVVRWICLRRAFDSDESEEFSSFVMIKLIEDDYRRIRAYRRRSSFRTYIVTVIQRLAIDFIVQKNGKWRPSAKAVHMGSDAIRLEELVYRQRFSFGEAQEIMRQHYGIERSRDQLWQLFIELPARRRVAFATVESVDELPSRSAGLEAHVDSGRLREIECGVRDAVALLSEQERLIVRLRFMEGLPPRRIAQVLEMDVRELHKGLPSILRRLRKALSARGISAANIANFAEVLPDTVDWTPLFEPGVGALRPNA